MPKHDELRTAQLWCVDCNRLFTGEAWYSVHTVEDIPEPTNVVFAYAASPCPVDPTHKVGDPAERR